MPWIWTTPCWVIKKWHPRDTRNAGFASAWIRGRMAAYKSSPWIWKGVSKDGPRTGKGEQFKMAVDPYHRYNLKREQLTETFIMISNWYLGLYKHIVRVKHATFWCWANFYNTGHKSKRYSEVEPSKHEATLETILGHRLQRWPKIQPALILVFSGLKILDPERCGSGRAVDGLPHGGYCVHLSRKGSRVAGGWVGVPGNARAGKSQLAPRRHVTYPATRHCGRRRHARGHRGRAVAHALRQGAHIGFLTAETQFLFQGPWKLHLFKIICKRCSFECDMGKYSTRSINNMWAFRRTLYSWNMCHIIRKMSNVCIFSHDEVTHDITAVDFISSYS